MLGTPWVQMKLFYWDPNLTRGCDGDLSETPQYMASLPLLEEVKFSYFAGNGIPLNRETTWFDREVV